jgi:HlyD family secretion protein
MGPFAGPLSNFGPKSLIIIVTGVAATAIVAVAMMSGSSSETANGHPSAQPIATVASAQQNPNRIAALGRLEPRSEIVSVSAPAQDRLQTLLVQRGDRVEKDQVLGHLSTYGKQVAERDVISARLEEARAQLDAEIAYGEAAVELARIQLRQVQELMPLRIAAQEAALVDAQVELANNKDILDSYNSLYEHKVSPRRLFENQRALVAQGEERVRRAKIQLSLLRQQLALDEANARAQLISAESALRRAKAAIAVKSLERLLVSAVASIDLTVIRAPVDGVILNILAHPGSPVNGTTILTMGDTSRMRAVAEVYETDARFVQVGQSATITSSALAKSLKGSVVSIGQMVFKNDLLNVDPAARSDARVVEVRIELEPDDLAASLSNLTVDVVIEAASEPKIISTLGEP